MSTIYNDTDYEVYMSSLNTMEHINALLRNLGLIFECQTLSYQLRCIPLLAEPYSLPPQTPDAFNNPLNRDYPGEASPQA